MAAPPIPDLDRLPDVMNKLNYPVSARLMRRWLGSPGLRMPGGAAATDLTDITMAWALRFARVQAAYKYSVDNTVWRNSAGAPAIVNWLKRQNAFQSTPVKFGNVRKPLPMLHEDAIQFHPVGGFMAHVVDPEDDLLASLGSFSFHFVVAGRTVPITVAGRLAGHDVQIEQVGIYIRDSYDFEGNEELGYWDLDRARMSKRKIEGGTPLNDSTFRAWRNRTGRGGDYLIFSDVKIETFNLPDHFRTER